MAWSAPATAVAASVLTAAWLNTNLRDNELILKVPIDDNGRLRWTPGTELTIASGIITATGNYHTVDTQADAATDDLDTITVGGDLGTGSVLTLQPESAARTVVLKDGTGNLALGEDIPLYDSHKLQALIYFGSSWRPYTGPSIPSQMFGGNSLQDASQTYYHGGPGAGATENLMLTPVSMQAVAYNLWARVGSAPSAGDTVVVTLRKDTGGGAADTALACTISDAETEASDLTDFIDFARGDYWAIKSVSSAGTPANFGLEWGFLFG